ncbi:pentapeptide repeat-containing protein [Nocardia arthritidis]|nr:pentapeptide repeat-containing protein [Nocardia arthritidis]
MPHQLADLPYARHLAPFDGDLEPEGDYECVHVDGRTLEDLAAGNARFTQCAFTGLVVGRGSLRFARFADVWLREVRWIGTDVSDTAWQDAEMIDGALSGVDAGGTNLRRIRFEGCKFDSVNFRKSVLRDVTFVDCVLRHTDFGDAKLTNVTFPGTALDDISFAKAQLAKVDLRGATALGVTDGLDALRGATINHTQLLDLAPVFARHLGLVVKD